LEGSGEVFGEVGGVVAAGVDVKLVGDVSRGEDFVEGGGAGFEAVVVLVATIEIDFEAGKISGTGKNDGAVAIPESGIGRIAEDRAEDAGARRAGRGAEEVGEFFDKRGAVCADGAEELRMAKSEVQGAVTTHGDAGDGAVGAPGSGAVTLFNEGKKFLEEEILVTVLPVSRIDVETRATIGSGDEEVLELLFFALVFDQVPEAGVDEELFVVAKAVEVIEDRIFFCFLSVEGIGEDDAVRDGAGEDLRGKGVAFDAACGEGGKSKEEKEKSGECREKKSAARAL